MRSLSRLGILLVLIALLTPLVIHAQDNGDVDTAKDIVAKFVGGDYADIYSQFDDQVKAAVTEDQLQQTWEGIIKDVGAFQQVSKIAPGPVDHSVILTLEFAKSSLDFGVSFGADGKVSGLRFRPAAGSTVTVEAPTPTYADASKFTEIPITVGDYNLPGILTMPTELPPAGSLFPAVVLISGSGPNDADETIGPNKPFRDIAWGLAAQGIATLRFDKRTKAAPQLLDLTHFTVNDEYVDDAVAAVELARQTEGIDPAKVFVLGHSQGGNVLPRIGQADSNIAGLIIASGSATPLQDAMLRQTRYILSLSGGTPAPDATEDPALTDIENQVAQIDALTPDSPSSDMLLFAPPSYWLDLRGYDAPALAASLPQPILVLQGERDYQVTVADDLPLWQKGLASHADTTFKTYPDLNHIYVTGTGEAVPSEYNQPGNVSKAVIDDVAAWVKAH